MDFTKEDAIRIVVSCAWAYWKQLNGRDFMFIAGNPDKPVLLRTTFGPRNYLHLTGLKLSHSSRLNPQRFFNACMTKRLSPNDFDLAEDGTTEMKLHVLPALMNLPKSARMIGDFSSLGVKLYTDKLVGGVYGCMGFVPSGDRYVPNTALNYDIRNITKNRLRILAVFSKPTSGKIYTKLCYLSKGITLADISIDDTFVFSTPHEDDI